MPLRAVNWKGDFAKWYKKLYQPIPPISVQAMELLLRMSCL